MEWQMENIVAGTGRLQYRALQSLVSRVSKEVFVSYCTRPFLVGSELLLGTFSAGEMTSTNTMPFKPVKLFEQLDDGENEDQRNVAQEKPGDSIKRAIFALCKQPFTNVPRNVYTLGNADVNDIVIADYSISKRHAQIRQHHKNFYIKDNSSKNGTYLDSQLLTPETEVRLELGSEIIIGRIKFVFVSEERLYDIVQADLTRHA